METGGTGRRTLLQGALALLTGGAAVAAGTRWGRGQRAGPTPDGSTLTLYARKRPLVSTLDEARGGHAAATRLLASGELLDAPDGRRIGDFYTNCFCLGTPFGPQAAAASNLEFQVLQLNEGTLFGVCGGSATPGIGKVHALVGGTDRYAGARGSYVERAAGVKAAGHDVVEFVVTLAS